MHTTESTQTTLPCGLCDETLAKVQTEHNKHLIKIQLVHKSQLQDLTDQVQTAAQKKGQLIRAGNVLKSLNVDSYDDHENLLYDLNEADIRTESDNVLILSRVSHGHSLTLACASKRKRVACTTEVARGGQDGTAITQEVLQFVADSSSTWWTSKVKEAKEQHRDLKTQVKDICFPNQACPMCMGAPSLVMICCGFQTCVKCLPDGTQHACPHCKADTCCTKPLLARAVGHSMPISVEV